MIAKFGKLAGRRSLALAGAVGAGTVAVVALVVGFVGEAWATGGDAVSDAFTSEKSSLEGYLGDAGVLLVAIVALSVGLLLFRRWTKRAASS